MFFRKNRDTSSDTRSEAASESSTSGGSLKSPRIPFSLARSLSRSRSPGSHASDHVEDPKGPLGLNTLYSPAEPKIDLIFVHGLGGGSRKTWSKTPSQSHYWPEEWLPKDPAFREVRIHSFGYDSDYLKRKGDCLNIHHYGKSLLGAMSTSPHLRTSGTHIITLGHSMGGLVSKKAYILARQDAAHQDLADRFAAMYFLGTPHRGADSAKILKNVLRVAYDRAYVADLERNSESIQVINDEFRHYSAGLELWSFYETQVMKLFSSLVVDPESAVLGYREEKQIPMTADHRSICKFEAPSDANYIAVRNALATTINQTTTGSLSGPVPNLTQRPGRAQIQDLKKYLGVSDILDDDLLNVSEARMHESCAWISDKDAFTEWKDGGPEDSRILWIKGKPATGKSVLAGYVVDQLRESDLTCSYFFFKHGDKSKSGLGSCLRSLAFQMATSNPSAQQMILEMEHEGTRLDHVDERTLWRLLFLSGILQATWTRHYWVIDALDECSDPSILFSSILSKIDKVAPGVRVLITSRDTPDLDQGFSGIPSNIVQSFSISADDTLVDLRRLVEVQTQALTIVRSEDRVSLVERILHKSRGSFLWTILVLKDLLRCYGKKEIDRSLDNVPREMEHLYKQILDSMSASARGKGLAQAVLMWATCAVRPLTTGELSGALSIELEDTFPHLEETIDALCGQLVVVDKFAKVHMVHETAREFLLSGALGSEFAINKSKVNTRMASVCLSYLVGEEMKPPRTNRRRAGKDVTTKRIEFAAYACHAYSYHLSRAEPLAADLSQFVQTFLKSNILTWIEAIATSGDLNQLIRASKHLKAYIEACALELSPLHPRVHALKQWAHDLARIPAIFSAALTSSPSAIYSLIPPFCPKESRIHSTSGPARRLTVLGTSSEQWDDRIFSIDFRPGQPSAVFHGEEFLAVGLSTGDVVVYYATSCQEYKVLNHGESVKFIRFKGKSDLLVTCGFKMVKVWDIRKGEVLHTLNGPPRPLDVDFYGNLFLVASHKNYIASWDLGKDALSQPIRLWSDSSETNRIGSGSRRPPVAVTISASHKVLAAAYNHQPITLWDMEEDVFLGTCGMKAGNGETSTHLVVALAFNPNPNIELLAVAYLDGNLALLNPFTDEQLECFRANCQTLAASPNGRLLAAGGADGIIHVFEFDTFKLLYRVKSSNSYIKQLHFARDSLRLADIRGTQCAVWEPETLLRDSLSDDSSGTTSTPMVETVSLEAKARITAMVPHPDEEVIFCGRDDGAVLLYDSKTAAIIRNLYNHKSSIRLLAWCRQKHALLSIDASNKMFLNSVRKPNSTAHGWVTAGVEVVFQSRLGSENAIIDVLIGEEAGKYIVSTRESDHLCSLESGNLERVHKHHDSPCIHKWILHPKSSLHVVRFAVTEARIYTWNDWSEVGHFAWSLDNSNTLQLKGINLCARGPEKGIILELSEKGGSTRTNGIMTLDAASYLVLEADKGSSSPTDEEQHDTAEAISSPGTTTRVPHPILGDTKALAQNIAHVIGITESGRLVFLDHSSWVCSADLSEDPDKHDNAGRDSQRGRSFSCSENEILKHFFIPHEWFAGRREMVCALVHANIACARGGDLAVIKGWQAI